MKVTNAILIKALQASGGICAHASRLIEESTGISLTRQAIHYRIKKSPELKKALEVITESFKDIVESKIMKKITNDDNEMIKFYAQAKMADRGYGKKLEVSGNPDQPLIPTLNLTIAPPLEPQK